MYLNLWPFSLSVCQSAPIPLSHQGVPFVSFICSYACLSYLYNSCLCLNTYINTSFMWIFIFKILPNRGLFFVHFQTFRATLRNTLAGYNVRFSKLKVSVRTTGPPPFLHLSMFGLFHGLSLPSLSTKSTLPTHQVLFDLRSRLIKPTQRSPGLVVMGGDSCSKGCEFESLHRILDGHFHIYLL